MRRLLDGRESMGSVSSRRLQQLACSGLLDHLLDRLGDDAARQLCARYEALFGDAVIGLQEDCDDGRRQKLPNGIFRGRQGMANAAILLRWVIEERLRWPVEEIPRRFSEAALAKHGYKKLLNPFGHHHWGALEAAYPGRWHPWEFSRCPPGFWTGPEGRSNAIAATRWLFETKLAWSTGRIRAACSMALFARHGLGGMVNRAHRGSPFLALDAAYPGRFRPWELCCMQGYWKGADGRRHAVDAVRWLIEEKLRWRDAAIREHLSKRTFQAHELGGMLSNAFGDSPWRALDALYPGRFQPWELRFCPHGYWRGPGAEERGRQATRWLIETRLRWTDDQVRELLTSEAFNDHGLRGMMAALYRSSPWLALEAAYPGRFRRDDLAAYHRGSAVDDMVVQLVRSHVRTLHARADAQRQPAAPSTARGTRPMSKRPRPGVDVALVEAIVAVAYEVPAASSAEAARLLRSRGIRTTPYVVRRVWNLNGLLFAKGRYRRLLRARQYPTAAAAARAIGVTPETIRRDRLTFETAGLEGLRFAPRIATGVERRIVDLALEQPGLGRKRLRLLLEEQGIVVREGTVRTVLDRHGLSLAGARLHARGSFPDNLASRPVLAEAIEHLGKGILAGAAPSRHPREASPRKPT
jgi:hypothetical protein